MCSTGCGRPVLARGWCATHYQRWFSTGSSGPRELLRTPGVKGRTEKPCRACGETKPVDEFYADKRVRDGRMSHCKKCFNLKNQQRRVMRLYRLSEADRQRMHANQGGRCAMCNEESVLVIDHCHKTDKVRALLCDRCNRLLGVANDDRRLFEAAIAYVDQHSEGESHAHS